MAAFSIGGSRKVCMYESSLFEAKDGWARRATATFVAKVTLAHASELTARR